MGDARKNYYVDGTFGPDVEENARIIAARIWQIKPGICNIGFPDFIEDVDKRDFLEAVWAFGCHFFQTSDLRHLLGLDSPAEIPLDRVAFEEGDVYLDDRGRKVRDRETDHLYAHQREMAEDILAERPEISEATHLYTFMVFNYMDLLKQALNDLRPDQTDYSDRMLRLLDNEIYVPASFDEMSEIVAPSLALSKGLSEATKDPVGYDLTHGILEFLQGDLSGFESATIRTSGLVTRKCPYQHAPGGFSTMWNTFFEAQEDGTYTARPMVGGFFNSVMGALYPDRYPQFAGANAPPDPRALEV